MVKTQGCGSCMRGFESHYPPHIIRRHSQVVRQRSAKPLFPSSNLGVASISLGYRQAVRQRILIPSCAGSNPATLAKRKTVDFDGFLFAKNSLWYTRGVLSHFIELGLYYTLLFKTSSRTMSRSSRQPPHTLPMSPISHRSLRVLIFFSLIKSST